MGNDCRGDLKRNAVTNDPMDYKRVKFPDANVSIEKLDYGTHLRISRELNLVVGDKFQEVTTIEFLTDLNIPPKLLREAADRIESVACSDRIHAIEAKEDGTA